MAGNLRLLAFFLAFAFLFGCASVPSNTMNASVNTSANLSAHSGEVVVLETSKGDIDIELNRSAAPLTVANFENYVNSGFYDGTIFHRVISGFMIQGGGFTPDGQQKATNPPIKLESDNGLKNIAGSIAMARTSDPDSATSQFFINTVDNPPLDYAPGNPGYTVFGQVISGMDVVHEIESVQTVDNGGYQDWPLQPVTIEKAYMENVSG